MVGCSSEQFLTGTIVSVSPFDSPKDSLYRYVVKSKDTVSEVISHYSGYKKDSTYTFRVKNYPTELPTNNTQQQQRQNQNMPRFSNSSFKIKII